jgi:FAD/FMN-containing dehydrogenase/Fe-S oxidoreductase
MSSSAPFIILGEHSLNGITHSHEGFNRARELEARLKITVRGEVRFDAGSRALYATDASNYRQVPIGLVIPQDEADVVATISASREFGAPVLPRGGGTSLAGQCCNVAVVLDFSKYMNGIQELDPIRRRAKVQPGIVLDVLRREAERFELTFAPDPATHSRCTLGAMIGNNSCGIHALMGGMTVDNIEALEILLYDGTRMRVGRHTDEEIVSIIRAGGRQGEIYAGLLEIRNQYETLIRQKFPRIPRRVSGYNLDQLLPENGFNVASSLVGSEGTCVTILSAECELTPSPQHRRLVALGFSDAFVAADHVPDILASKPIGLEGFDGLLVDYMLRKSLVVEDVKLLPKGRGLLCEFGADSPALVEEMVDSLLEATVTFNERPAIARYGPIQAARVWKVRESALGGSVFVPGEQVGWEGWEDSAVPPKKLGLYLRELFGLIESYGYKTPMYGHFGQGCVHLRITFDLKTAEGIAKYRRFLDKAAEVVLTYGGSFSGEHGDGQARAALLPKMFGEELMQAFAEFKALWDPSNRMNPGKLIDPVAVYDPTENLRIGESYKPSKVKTWFQYPADGGSFSEATTRCVGVGACRTHDNGTMCPSYMATREEKHSTRGRAHLLWEMLQGNALEGGFQNEEVKEALDLCLSCKACKTECPVNVDIATWKSEFLAHHYKGKFHPLHHYAFGFMDRWANIASLSPGLANFPLKLPAVNSLVKRSLGIAPQRELPPFAGESFRRSIQRSVGGDGARVLLWPDTWNNYFLPESLHSAYSLLREAGFSVSVPKKHVCCGRPLYDFGFLDQARNYLEAILEHLGPEIDAGIPVVMLELSCASVFRDELLNFFPKNDRAKRLSEETVMLSALLKNQDNTWTAPNWHCHTFLVHGHCHQKSLLSMEDDLSLLRETGGEVRLLDAGCCGMAGPFGFEADKYEVSQTLAERVLLPAARAADRNTLFVMNGFSCREQIRQNHSQVRTLHISEVLKCAPTERRG